MTPALVQPHLPHPRTLLGAARVTLEQAEGRHGQHLQARAAMRLGYVREARAMWERMAREDDAQAWFELGRLAQSGLGERADAAQARHCFAHAARLGHAEAASRRA